MGKDNLQPPSKPAEIGDIAGKDAPSGTLETLGKAAAIGVSSVTLGERDAVRNDKSVSASGFRAAGDILPEGKEATKRAELPSEKLPVVANPDGSTSVIRPDNAVVNYDKPNVYGDTPKIQLAQYDQNGAANRFESYSVIKGDLIQSRYERGADGQWSTVDYKGNRTPAQATDTGKGSLVLKPEGAQSVAEQVRAYSDGLFAQMRRENAPPDPVAEAARRSELERSLYMGGMNQALRDSLTSNHSDGSKYVPNRNGGGVEISGDGQVTQTRSVSDLYTKYGYGTDKSLSSIDTFEVSKTGTGVQHTQYLKEADGAWVSVNADGTKTPSARSFAVDSDGTLKVTSDGKTTSVGLDGKTTLSGLPKEKLPLKSAIESPVKTADSRDIASDPVFEPSTGFKSSQAAGSDTASSSGLLDKIAATDQWLQATPAERAQTVAAIEKAGLTGDQEAELSERLGKPTKLIALTALVSGLLALAKSAEAETIKKQAPGPTTYGN